MLDSGADCNMCVFNYRKFGGCDGMDLGEDYQSMCGHCGNEQQIDDYCAKSNCEKIQSSISDFYDGFCYTTFVGKKGGNFCSTINLQ